MLDQQKPKVAGGRVHFGSVGRLALPIPAVFKPLSERPSQLKVRQVRVLLPDIALGLLAGALVLVAFWLLMHR